MAERQRVALVCGDCGARNYETTKARSSKKILELKKYCGKCKRHTVHRESK